jgi:hypothetical protein
MTPAEFIKMRRLEVMRQRLRRQVDPHLVEMQAYRMLMEEHLTTVTRLASRQTDALEGIETILMEYSHARTR